MVITVRDGGRDYKVIGASVTVHFEEGGQSTGKIDSNGTAFIDISRRTIKDVYVSGNPARSFPTGSYDKYDNVTVQK